MFTDHILDYAVLFFSTAAFLRLLAVLLVGFSLVTFLLCLNNWYWTRREERWRNGGEY